MLNRLLPYLFLLIPMTWAGSFIAGKFVIADLDPVVSTLMRFALSALVMLPGLALLHRKHHPPLRNPYYWLHLGIVALLFGTAYHLLFFAALQYISPTDTALIIALNPFFTALGEVILLKRTRPKRFYYGFALAMFGALWVNLARGGRFDLASLGLGHLLAFGGTLTFSAYSLLAGTTRRDNWDSMWTNGYAFLITAIVLVPVVGWDSLAHEVAGMTQSAWLGSWYMAIFPTAIGYTLFYIGVQLRGAAWSSTFIYLVPSFTAVLDHAFFRASVTLPMVLGTTLVVGGLLLGNWPRRPRVPVVKR